MCSFPCVHLASVLQKMPSQEELSWNGKLTAVLVGAVVFRLLTEVVERAWTRHFGPQAHHDVAIATYRSVGLVHHTIQVPYACIILADPFMWQNRLFSYTQLSTWMVIISSSYFLHDLVHCIQNVKVQGVSYVLHGAGCASVYLFSLLQQPTMLHFYGAGFLMWEISSFFVHARWFMFKYNARKLYQNLNGLGLLISFTFARIVWGFWLSYMYWTDILAYKSSASPAFVYTTLAANIALNLLNTYWWVMILEKVMAALSGKRSDSIGKRD